MLLRAREANSSHWAALPVSDGYTQGTLLGSLSFSETTVRRQRHKLVSMALVVLPALPAFCYGVFPLPDGRYWFMAVSDGTLSPFADIVGDDSAIRTAVSHFLQSSSPPVEGWTVYAPDGFFADRETEEKTLQALIANRGGLRRAGLNKTHDHKEIWLWGLALVALVAGYLAYTGWQRQQQAARIAAAQARLMQMKKDQARTLINTPDPWNQMPPLSQMLTACRAVWQAAPVSIAGWKFTTAKCDISGNVTFQYNAESRGNVADFAARLPVIYGPDRQASFNIPGSGDQATFTLPVALTIPARGETLLAADQQIQQLVSYAQRIQAGLSLNQDQAAMRSASDTSWRSYSFRFISPYSPGQLFTAADIDNSGFRASGITATLNGHRLEYTIEGVLYVSK